MRLEIVLSPTLGASATARRELDKGLTSTGIDEELMNLVRLGTSELVTNALQHGGLRPEDSLVLEASDEYGVIRIGVSQPSSAAKARRVVERDRTRFGLHLIEEMADRWGVEDGPPGRVWFEMGHPMGRRQTPPEQVE